MSIPSSRLASLLLLATGLVGVGDAIAQRGDRGRNDEDGRERSQDRDDRGHDPREDHRALSDAVRRVERRTGGQVLSAERVPFDGRDVNRVKVVDSSGRVRVYMDDPGSAGNPAGNAARNSAARNEPPRTRGDDD